MAKYRLYIDESGSHEYVDSESQERRYLGLVGIIVEFDKYENGIKPQIKELQGMFDPDEDVILHREDIVNKKGVFARLDDLEFKTQFNEKVLNMFVANDYVLCVMVLDKRAHYKRYGGSAYHPYHYCVNVLLERYVIFLEEINSRGDIMAEARGKKEDGELRSAFDKFYKGGTSFVSEKRIQQRLFSKDIKIKPKAKGFAGLQFADLLALPLKLFVLKEYGKISSIKENFTKNVITKSKSHIRQGVNGKIKGYGIKLLE